MAARGRAFRAEARRRLALLAEKLGVDRSEATGPPDAERPSAVIDGSLSVAPIASIIEVDDVGVRRTQPDGRIDYVRWDELVEVRCVTTSDGPALDDVFYVLLGPTEDRGCVLPQPAMDREFLARLQALPGFDNEALCDAMATAVDDQFLLWQRRWTE